MTWPDTWSRDNREMRYAGKLAVLLSLAAVALTWWISAAIFEQTPHLEDEQAYVWQAQTAARGDLSLASPTCPSCFLYPFVIDYAGQRFGKYPPGWPAVLSLGLRLNARSWVNPLLAGLAVWFTYRLARKLVSPGASLLACAFLVISPFFLINSASLLSHPWSLFLTTVLSLAWLDSFFFPSRVPHWMLVLAAGSAIGLLVLTRPLTAAAVALPFFWHGLWLLLKGSPTARRQVLAIGLTAAPLAALLFLWQYALTGSFFTNPYTLWWPYDTVGFGPQVGLQPGGYTPLYAYANARFSLSVGASDLFGWGRLSWLFLPFGLFALRRSRPAWLLSALLPSLVLVYSLYWIGSWVFGPRYYYEALLPAVILNAAGIRFAAGSLAQISHRWLSRLRFGMTVGLVSFLTACALIFYLPQRLDHLKGLYGVSRSAWEPFVVAQAQGLSPALVIVHPASEWIEYGRFLDLSSPYLDTPFIFTHSRGIELDAQVAAAFPNRKVYHYYTDTPFTFYLAPR